jgi:hypothetical protein
MTTQQVTIDLPEPIFRQLAHIAKATQQSIETLVAQSVVSNLPPSVDNAPLEMQAELLQLQTLGTEDLLTIAHAKTEPEHHERCVELLDLHQDDKLTPSQRQELAQLRQAADRLMLRKAYAWSVLRWQGHPIPALKNLPIVE